LCGLGDGSRSEVRNLNRAAMKGEPLARETASGTDETVSSGAIWLAELLTPKSWTPSIQRSIGLANAGAAPGGVGDVGKGCCCVLV
jgi:hypothetical protein